MALARKAATKPSLDAAGLLEMAVRSLASQMKSERDLRRRLLARAEPGETGGAAVDEVMGRLRALGYLSDERFAADFIRLRQENQKLGRRRVGQALAQKGVPAPIAQAALAHAYDDVDETVLARQYAERKRLKAPSGPPEQKARETARTVRRLLAAGFSSRAVWAVLRGWGEAGLAEADLDSADLDPVTEGGT